MQVTVRLFARLRDVAGVGECRCDVPERASVDEVWRTLVQRYPSLAPYAGSISRAVNADFARGHVEVHDGDEVAFLPPVSGG